MKTCRHLYKQITEFENLYLAWRLARKGKRGKPPAADFERIQDEELLALQRELRGHTYQPGPYHSFFIHEPKRRLISAAPFRDRVVHHALCRVIEPIWEQRFIFDSYANRVGKGTHRAIDRAQQFARRYRYFLQCDVRQFFPSIDHAILRAELTRLIADEKTLWLCDQILASGTGVLSEEYDMVYYPGDSLFDANRPRGLPIGNLTSQFWANVYLNDFDHFVKRTLKCKAYVRYVDDFILFADQKTTLLGWKQAITKKLAVLRLSIHENKAHVFPVTTGIPFLGFGIYPDHRLLKRKKYVKFRRHFKKLRQRYARGDVSLDRVDASVQGWVNHVRYGDTLGLRRAILSQPTL